MKSISILAGLTAAAVVAAAPAEFQNSTDVTWTPSPSDQTTCDPSSFSQAPIAGAADWRYCAALSSAWANENGTFSIHDVSGSAFIPVLKTEGCVLGVKASEQGQGPYTIGDQDVKAILRIALEDYSEGTDLSVEGSVKCNVASGGRSDLQWQIAGQ
ncbi:putative necrosis-inducing factor [Trichoderma breve]|uniref:Necrosis-inducing factor n=1 Tax=Trichoderma breve TaxID=2034170 RepID=A0A9W9B4P2_9HYPO|nr:putative necrosis-inducing factor [Trichoderma breve]KAJ4855692.1 putative necrosis-inducing factor [Trichoderma breve]